MLAARQRDELHRQLQCLKGLGEFLRLRWRHLRIGIAMDQEQRRIILVEMCHGAGELGEIGLLRRLATKEELQRRHAHLQTKLRAL